MTQTRDEMFMREALRLAREAEAAGEVPVGAVVVIGEEIAGRGFNRPIGLHDPTAHAEMLALREAARTVNNYRLSEAEVFVTLEPCVMCAGALVQARVRRLVFGSRDLRFGGVRSKFRLADSDLLNHRMSIEEGLLGGDSVALIERFFQQKRRSL
jgi:tRNA(adenine34) deaminase